MGADSEPADKKSQAVLTHNLLNWGILYPASGSDWYIFFETAAVTTIMIIAERMDMATQRHSMCAIGSK